MTDALKVSSDVFFYNLGLHATASGNGGPDPGLGAASTGSGSGRASTSRRRSAGLIPDPAWRNRLYPRAPHRPALDVRRQRQPRRRPGRPAGRPAADGGRLRGDRQRRHVVRPHVGDDVESVTGQVLEEIRPAPRRHLDISPTHPRHDHDRAHPCRDGAGRDLLSRSSGTSRSRSPARPVPRSAPNQPDQSWYMVLAPAKNPQIVVAVTLERGGFGVDTAAPVARGSSSTTSMPITPARIGRQDAGVMAAGSPATTTLG